MTYKKIAKTIKHFEIELKCYKRLSKFNHFPTLIKYNREDLSLTLSHCGNNLLTTSKKITNKEIIKQAKNISNTLKECNIIHLDLKPDNICVKENTIYLIDFGVACIDCNSVKDVKHQIKSNILRSKTQRLYLKFIESNSYEGFECELIKILIEHLSSKIDFQI